MRVKLSTLVHGRGAPHQASEHLGRCWSGRGLVEVQAQQPRSRLECLLRAHSWFCESAYSYP